MTINQEGAADAAPLDPPPPETISGGPPPADPPPLDPPPLEQAVTSGPEGWRGVLARERGLLLVLVIIAGALFLFLEIASEVMEGDTLAIDRSILVGLRDAANPEQPIGPGWLNEAMTDLTSFGSTTGLLLVSAAVIGFLLISRRPWTALFVLGATGGGAIMGMLLKLLYERPRPNVVPHLVDVTWASFPSGHATDSAIVYLTLAALLARTTKRRAERFYIIGAAVLLTVSIGISRVYLGVHWPSDVLAGWTIGCSWALLCSIAYRRFQRQQSPAP
jgi:undecaprenyl-diphosphatase